MTDVAFDILAGADDGNCQHSGGTLQSSFDYAYFGGRFATTYRSFFRFQNVVIPSDAVIDSAVIRLVSTGNYSVTTCNAIIHFEDEDDPSAPSVVGDVQEASLTTGADWDSIVAWTQGESYDSPDISSDLQEVIDRAGWNSGQAVIVHVLNNGSSATAFREAASFENSTYSEAQLIVSYHLPNEIVVSESIAIAENISLDSALVRQENVEVAESIDVLLGFDESLPLISQGLAVSEFVAFELEFTGEVEEADNIGLSVYRNVELEGPKISVVENLITISETVRMEYLAEASDDVEVSESVTVQRGYDVFASDSFAFDDTFEAFNYSGWLKANLSVARLRFFCTITGAADLQSDVEIPIRSFYARKKSGDPSYLQVVVPGFGYAAAVANRPNGDLILEVGYEVDGVVSLREQISVVDIDDISIAEGGINRSITVAGHRTITYGKNYIEIARKLATYHALQKNVLSYRFAYIDPYLNPGDTLVVGETAMTVNNVIYIVDPLRSTMQVSEA
jgi:hypothetical protein